LRLPIVVASECPLQISECLLQTSKRYIRHPSAFGTPAPLGELEIELCQDQARLTLLTALKLNRQRLIEYKSATTRNSAHLTRLTAIGSKFEFVGLIALHALILDPDGTAYNTINSRKHCKSASAGLRLCQAQKSALNLGNIFPL
jgi:hypothetical protein